MITLAVLVFIITFLLNRIIYKRYKYNIKHNVEDALEKAVGDNFLLFSFAFIFNFISLIYTVVNIVIYLP
jgi:hypothetical protein